MITRPIRSITASLIVLAVTAACSPATPEEVRASEIVRCKEHFSVVARNDAEADALCDCMVDTLDERGMFMGDMFSSRAEEVKDVVGICARKLGIPPNA